MSFNERLVSLRSIIGSWGDESRLRKRINLFKILTSIFFLFVIIPGQKLGFPVILLILFEMNTGFLSPFCSITLILFLFYLFISGIVKLDSKLDDLIVLITITALFVFLFSHIIDVYRFGDIVVYMTVLIFMAISLTLLTLTILKMVREHKKV
jgi:hypothetical protein